MIRSLLLLVLCTPAALARPQAHPEIVLGCDAAGRIVARFDAASPKPLPGARFYGIGGYADAMPGISTFLDPESDKDLRQLDPSARIVFVLEGVDEGLVVWNDRGTGTMGVGEVFVLGPPPFDAHPVWNIVDGTPGTEYALRLRIRDTTGKHADSEIVVLRFTPDDTTELFVCPMQCRGGNWYPAAGACPECGMALKLLSGRNHRVSVTVLGETPGEAGVLRAGTPATLRFALASPAGEPITKLEVVHEKLLHLLMVSNDLSWFAHEHPELRADGTFELSFAFPHGGAFTLYHDFTPPRVGMQVVPVTLEVQGDAPAPVPLVADGVRTRTVDGYRIELASSGALKTMVMQSLVFRIARDGAPVTDLEPFLGAMGHLIVISADREQFVHSHPLETVTATGARQTGPEVVFSAQFPAPGLYKAWGQFQHEGRVITAPFVLDVRPVR